MPDTSLSQTINWTTARIRALQVDLADEAAEDRLLAMRQCLENACLDLDGAGRQKLLGALRERFPALPSATDQPVPVVDELPPDAAELAKRLVERVAAADEEEQSRAAAVLSEAGLVVEGEPAEAPSAADLPMGDLVAALAARVQTLGPGAKQGVLTSLGIEPPPAAPPAPAPPAGGEGQALPHLAEAMGQLNTILQAMWDNLRPDRADGRYPTRGLEDELRAWLAGENSLTAPQLRSRVNELVRFAAAVFAALPVSLDTYTRQLANRLKPATIENVVGTGMLAKRKCWDRYCQLAEKEFSSDHAQKNLLSILLGEIRNMRDAGGA
ncbi:MAG: hypothetical protein HN380_04270 [Victivallales bacterium]|jgi:hypothetical protein|nr:hypothetical protein [Victivallales bacterium]